MATGARQLMWMSSMGRWERRESRADWGKLGRPCSTQGDDPSTAPVIDTRQDQVLPYLLIVQRKPALVLGSVYMKSLVNSSALAL